MCDREADLDLSFASPVLRPCTINFFTAALMLLTFTATFTLLLRLGIARPLANGYSDLFPIGGIVFPSLGLLCGFPRGYRQSVHFSSLPPGTSYRLSLLAQVLLNAQRINLLPCFRKELCTNIV